MKMPTNKELADFIGEDVKNVAASLENKGLNVFIIDKGHYIKTKCDFNKVILVHKNSVIVKAEVG